MKPGKQLEHHVQQVYTWLLNMKDEGVVVGNSVLMTGKSGLQHEIDVYYEFVRAGVRHRVAIECKDWKTPVSKGQILEFEAKLRDVGNITGVVVSRCGYHSGADTFAKHADVLPLCFDDLPSMGVLIGQRLTTVGLPDETYVGEPFWTIMEVRDGKTTGSHYARPNECGGFYIPLVYSKAHAERFFHREKLDPRRWAIRGLPRFALRGFLVTLEFYEKRMNGGAKLLFLQPGAPPDAPFIGLSISREDLIREYYGGEIPSIEAPLNRPPETQETLQST